MTPQVQMPSITKNDLIKDCINFALVIVLSFFFKFSILELAESIWFFSVVLAVSMLLFQFIKCFEYKNFKIGRLVSIVCTVVFYVFMYIGVLFGIREILGLENTPLNVYRFLIYIPCIPFVLFSKRDYFKEFVWQDKDNIVSGIGFLIFLKLVGLAILIYNLRENQILSFGIIYTLYFFPFVKTYKFLKQKKEVK